MPKPRELTGERNGKIEALCLDRREGGKSYWKVRCDCGMEWVISLGNFSHTTGCRKCQYKALGAARKTHGMSGTKIHMLWRRHFERLCESWRKDLKTFEDESNARNRKPRQLLVAIDDTKPIGPGNYRWKARSKKGRIFTVGNFTGSLTDYGRLLGVTRERVRQLMAKHGNMTSVVVRLLRSPEIRQIEWQKEWQRKLQDRRKHIDTMLSHGGVEVFALDHKRQVRKLSSSASRLGLSTRIIDGDGSSRLFTLMTENNSANSAE